MNTHQTNPEVRALVRRAIRIQKELEGVKSLYREFDDIIAELYERGFTAIEFGPFLVSLEDSFKEATTAWKATAFRRFGLKVELK